MALEGAPIRFCATTTCSDLGWSRNSGLAFNLRFRLEKFRKWEFCCLGVFAKRDASPVEDHKPYVRGVESSRTIEQTQGNESRGNQDALKLLPSELTQSPNILYFKIKNFDGSFLLVKVHLFVPPEKKVRSYTKIK